MSIEGLLSRPGCKTLELKRDLSSPQPVPELDSEAIDFAAASDCFSETRKLRRKDLTSLGILRQHEGRHVPSVGGVILFGILLPGLTVDEIRDGVSRLRNRVIGRVLMELGLVEQWGSGIQRMVTA